MGTSEITPMLQRTMGRLELHEGIATTELMMPQVRGSQNPKVSVLGIEVGPVDVQSLEANSTN